MTVGKRATIGRQTGRWIGKRPIPAGNDLDQSTGDEVIMRLSPRKDQRRPKPHEGGRERPSERPFSSLSKKDNLLLGSNQVRKILISPVAYRAVRSGRRRRAIFWARTACSCGLKFSGDRPVFTCLGQRTCLRKVKPNRGRVGLDSTPADGDVLRPGQIQSPGADEQPSLGQRSRRGPRSRVPPTTSTCRPLKTLPQRRHCR